jgi:BirA family biotin operon repressor/biotin-[acetyl-CoA-carboxylase] ligase
MPYIGQPYHYLQSLDSTNAEAWRLYQRGALPPGGLVRAEYQSAGRGQQGARWDSQPGDNLLISTLLAPHQLPVRRLFALNQVAALAVRDTLAEYLSNARLSVKWPNDVMVADDKIAGILIETHLQQQQVAAAVLGIGLNVNQAAFPGGYTTNATSMQRELGRAVDREALLSQLCLRLTFFADYLAPDQLAVLQSQYHRYLYRRGQTALFRAGGERFQGQILGIDAEGLLRLQSARGIGHYAFKQIEYL